MKTLLLADDSVTIQRVIELTFAHEDIRVVSVSDGRRALQWMENDSPDIVLVDVEVPEVDGYTVAAHVKESRRLKGVPVLLLAGAFEPVDQERVRSLDCAGVLVKPFEPQQLVARVKSLLQRATTAAIAHEPELVRRHDGDSATVTPFPGPARASTAHTMAAVSVAEPEPLEPPTRPVWESGPSPAPIAGERFEAHAPAPSRVSLVNAFSALLAAEQSSQPSSPAPPAVVVPEALVESVVHRVLAAERASQPAPIEPRPAVVPEALVEDVVHRVLAAERASQPAPIEPPPVVVPEALVEDAVRRVLAAERASQPAPVEPPPAVVPEALVEDVVHRVLAAERASQPAPIEPPPPVVVPEALVEDVVHRVLAAERASQPAPVEPPPVVVPEALVEGAVRRVLTEMTDDQVRRIVAETAERLVREEIERIKANPE